MLNKEDYKRIQSRVQNETSLAYAMMDYSNWNEIEDEGFHELRDAYVMAHNNLCLYIGLPNSCDTSQV